MGEAARESVRIYKLPTTSERRCTTRSSIKLVEYRNEKSQHSWNSDCMFERCIHKECQKNIPILTCNLTDPDVNPNEFLISEPNDPVLSHAASHACHLLFAVIKPIFLKIGPGT